MLITKGNFGIEKERESKKEVQLIDIKGKGIHRSSELTAFLIVSDEIVLRHWDWQEAIAF